MKKREPEPVALAEGGVLVKHCDDVALAERLARSFAARENDVCPGDIHHKRGRRMSVRIMGALPGSLAEAEGWAWEYRETSPGRGAFRAVEFLPGLPADDAAPRCDHPFDAHCPSDDIEPGGCTAVDSSGAQCPCWATP